MAKLCRLNELSEAKVQSFIESVDAVLFDVDGVLLTDRVVIPGADSAVEKLRALGKQIGFVTNNSLYSVEKLRENLSAFGATLEEIVNPTTSLLEYLRKSDFKKDIYVISTVLPKQLLRQAGYNVIEFKDIQREEVEPTLAAIYGLQPKVLEMCKNVGLVYLDYDMNVRYGDIQCALDIIRCNDDVQILSGLNDDEIPGPGGSIVIGVLARASKILPGAPESVAKLRQLGKKIGFVTNNALLPTETIKGKLSPFEATLEEIITPNTSLLAHLKNIQYQKSIYIIGSPFTKMILRDAGYSVIEYKDLQAADLEETVDAVKKLSLKALDVCKNVGIVYVDLDINLQNLEVHVAYIILKHLSGVQLLTGTSDDKIPIGEHLSFIGPKYFMDALQRWTGVQTVPLAKPGQVLKGVIESRFGIVEDQRVLMVGDNLTRFFGNHLIPAPDMASLHRTSKERLHRLSEREWMLICFPSKAPTQ